jgi:hypothetical protein
MERKLMDNAVRNRPFAFLRRQVPTVPVVVAKPPEATPVQPSVGEPRKASYVSPQMTKRIEWHARGARQPAPATPTASGPRKEADAATAPPKRGPWRPRGVAKPAEAQQVDGKAFAKAVVLTARCAPFVELATHGPNDGTYIQSVPQEVRVMASQIRDAEKTIRAVAEGHTAADRHFSALVESVESILVLLENWRKTSTYRVNGSVTCDARSVSRDAAQRIPW